YHGMRLVMYVWCWFSTSGGGFSTGLMGDSVLTRKRGVVFFRELVEEALGVEHRVLGLLHVGEHAVHRRPEQQGAEAEAREQVVHDRHDAEGNLHAACQQEDLVELVDGCP